ncbi:MAG TPA: ParB/RepB/Spo0J family partition protein [Polyangia bacterium]|nr:ParB/RepB/Spo0J family partition protein [Polyangia bacterium]
MRGGLRSLPSLAAQLEASSREATAVIEISVDAISPNPQQPRTQFDEKQLEELAASIKAEGIQQPIGVTEPAPGTYELVFGERRLRASKLAGLALIKAVVKTNLTEVQKLTYALIENLDREEMTAFDEARGVAKLVEMLGTQEAAATALHKPKSWVSKRVAVAGAQPFVAEFAGKGAVSDTEALYELAKLAESDADEAQRLIAGYEPGGNLRAQVKAAQRPGHENPESDDEEESPRGALVAGGRTGSGGGEPNLARAGRGGGRDEDVDSKEVSHAKLPKASKPASVKAVLRRGTQIILVTEEGKLHFEFTATAKKQLLKILDA